MANKDIKDFYYQVHFQ